MAKQVSEESVNTPGEGSMAIEEHNLMGQQLSSPPKLLRDGNSQTLGLHSMQPTTLHGKS